VLNVCAFLALRQLLGLAEGPRIIDDRAALLLNHAPKFFANRDKKWQSGKPIARNCHLL